MKNCEENMQVAEGTNIDALLGSMELKAKKLAAILAVQKGL